MADSSITVRDDPASGRYQAFVDGDLAGYSAYRAEPGRIVFTHTKIDPDYEGMGVGGALARAALDDARSKGVTVVPRCPFIAAFIQRHEEYRDLVAA